MLRPLLCLFALVALTGAQQTVTGSAELDISSCAITYYGETYENLYVSQIEGDVYVCFTGFYDPQTEGDCIVQSPLEENSLYFEIFKGSSTDDDLIHKNFAGIKNSVDCRVQLSSSDSSFVLYKIGKQTVIQYEVLTSVTPLLDVRVGGNSIESVNVTSSHVLYLSDISGCRDSGQLYFPGSEISFDPETCTTITCSETADINTSDCGPLKSCQGNNICVSKGILDTICTVTGPTVIDIYGKVNSIPDRCVYTLVSVPSFPDFLVLGHYEERRRRDVSFLDSVGLHLNGNRIHLEQGGRFQLNETTMTLDDLTQLVHDVEISEDQTGVTAKLSLSGLTISIFFDGYTAQIHFTGNAVPYPEGLCGNSSRSLDEVRFSEYSPPSCLTQYSDTADSTINCDEATASCSVLKEAPFSSCNNDIDPEPYITACTDTLCKYPSVDDLDCQFLRTYARACSLQGNHSLEDWALTTGCSPDAFCQDSTCSDHEFCGETTVSGDTTADGDEAADGDTRCFCRPIFASKYRSTDSFGDPTICSDNSASLTLVGCLLEDKGIDYSTLHLNDLTCTGDIDELNHTVTFSIDDTNSCGTVITTTNSQIIYKNVITDQNNSSDIIREDQVYIDFSCFYTQPDIKTESFTINDSIVIEHITSGAWNYTLTMMSFTDAERTQAVNSSTELQLNQKIWVQLETDGLDGDAVNVVTDSCWATADPSPNSTPKHDLIKDSCANRNDTTVEVEQNGQGTSTYFSFNMFQFTGHSGKVYLHCKLHLCPTQDSNCILDCNTSRRRRRSARATYEGEGLISMAWTH